MLLAKAQRQWGSVSITAHIEFSADLLMLSSASPAEWGN